MAAKVSVSVIIPVYNAEKSLERCVRSVMGQTYRDIGIILVDDCSTDDSALLMDRLALEDERIKVIRREENGGLMRCWMTGLGEATGEYISFVDSDDYIESDMIEALADGLSGDGRAQVVCCGYRIEYQDGRPPLDVYNGLRPGVYEGEALARAKAGLLGNEERTVIFSRCMKLIPARLLRDNLRYCDPLIRMGEDVNIMLPVLMDAERIVIIKGHADYHYVYEEGSMAHGYDPGLHDNILRLMRAIDRVMKEKGYTVPGGRYKKEISEGIQREYILLFMLVIKISLRSGSLFDPSGDREIAALIRNRRMRERLLRYAPELKETANRLMSVLVKHPHTFISSVLRLIFVGVEKWKKYGKSRKFIPRRTR